MTSPAARGIPPRRLKKLFQSLFLILGCIHLTGGPHALIQAYAWANMIVSYSQEGSIGEAVADTFSGGKPCQLCKRIEASKSVEKENRDAPLPPGSPKPFQDLFAPSAVSLKDPSSTPFLQPAFLTGGDPLSPSACGPPVPPPRC